MAIYTVKHKKTHVMMTTANQTSKEQLHHITRFGSEGEITGKYSRRIHNQNAQ